MEENNSNRFWDCSSLEEAIERNIWGVSYPESDVFWWSKNSKEYFEFEYLEKVHCLRTDRAKHLYGPEAEDFRLSAKGGINDSDIERVITRYFQAKGYQLKGQSGKLNKVFQKGGTLLSVNVVNPSLGENNESILGSVVQYKIKNGKIRNVIPHKITRNRILEYKLIGDRIAPFKYSKLKKAINRGRRIKNEQIKGYR